MKMAEPIEPPFGIASGVGPRISVFHGTGSARWRHVASTTERLFATAMSGSVASGGDGACSQITLLVFARYQIY